MNQQIPNAQDALDTLMGEHFADDAPPSPSRKPTTKRDNTGDADHLFRRAQRYAQKVGNVGDGNRNNAAFQLAGHLAAFTNEQTGETLTEDQIANIVLDWNTGNTPPLPDNEIRAAVRSGINNGTPRESKPDRPHLSSRAASSGDVSLPETYQGPHGIELTPISARTIGNHGKVEVAFDVAVDGKPQAPMKITTSASSIRDNSRDLVAWAELAHDVDRLTNPERVKIHQFIANAMNDAPRLAEHFKLQQQAQPKKIPEGPTIQSIIIGEAPAAAGLTFKEHDGRVWSETEGRPIDAREFQNWITPALVRLCEQALDYPEDRVGLSAPVGALRQYLPLAWNYALARLPTEVKADTGPDSKAAKRYAAAIVRLFSIRERWKKTYSRDGSDHAMDSATLAQLAREKIEAQSIDQTSGWQRIHNSAIDAWFCTTPRRGDDSIPTGEPPDAWLAFRYELVNELPKHSRPELPNTRDQNELTRIANRYSLTASDDATAPVAKVKEKGKQRRVVVLNRALTNLILWQWDDGSEPDENMV